MGWKVHWELQEEVVLAKVAPRDRSEDMTFFLI